MRLSPLTHAPLGDLVRIKSGGTPSKGNAAYWGDDLPWITAKDLKSRYLVGSIQKLSAAGRSVATIAPVDALLILVRGMGLFKDIPIGICKTEAAFNQDVKALIPDSAIDSGFLYCALESLKPVLMQLVEAAGHGTGRLDTAKLLALPIPLPPLPEQRRIAAALGTWDAAIETTERLVGLAAQALSARRILLLSSRHNRNRREWRTATLGDVTEELTSRNGTRLTAASVMGVIKGDGFQPMRERTIGSDLSRYKIVPPSAFAYNPMRLNIGSLAFSTFTTDILVSPDYVVFAAKRETCAPEFVNELRQSPRWAAWCQQGGSGSVRTRIYYSDLIGMPIDLPPLSTQRRIAAVLADLTTRHRTAVRRAELLRRQKTGLMQKLLTGKIRVPESVADLSPAAD